MPLERVILLLKLRAAPQMAFVLAGDLLRDRVKAADSFKPGKSLGSAGKALLSRQAERQNVAAAALFPP